MMLTAWTLTLPHRLRVQMEHHLFPGDNDEHGAVLLAGITRVGPITRLLAREFLPARDGIDYVPGTRGYRQLTASFVRDGIVRARDERLAYLAVHNHGGEHRIAFSSDDNASHERGYRALLDIANGPPVGAIVVAEHAVAGDIWEPGGGRHELAETRLLGPRIERLTADAGVGLRAFDSRFDRGARLFGDIGQAMLGRTKMGIIGAGGVGMLLTEYLARSGVGALVIADPERVDVTNLPRLPGSRGSDTRVMFSGARWPAWLRGFGAQTSHHKVDLAQRLAREAAPNMSFEAIVGDFLDPAVVARFRSCDYLFLAADSMQARLLFSALVNADLIPGVQVGAKALVDRKTGDVLDVHSVVRPLWPGEGCLWCNGAIPPAKLVEEAETPARRRAQRYVDDPGVRAPAVMALNATAASQAANDALFMVTGLSGVDATPAYLLFKPRERTVRLSEPRRDPDCPFCSPSPTSVFARGDAASLPVKVLA
jgi:hypothetical protein